MKLIFLLTTVLLLAPPAHAAQVAPYTAFTWSPVSIALPHSQQMYGLRLDLNPALAARTIAAMRKGRRVVLISNAAANAFDDDLLKCKDGTTLQSPWLDHGRKNAAAKWDAWEKLYTAAGGPPIEFAAIDAEFGWSTWNTGPASVAAIQADPRYAALAKTFDIKTVTPNGYSPQWDNAMGSLRNDTLRDVFGKLAESFGNYGDVIVPPSLSNQARDLNGWPSLWRTLAGTHQCPDFYGWIAQIKNDRGDGTHPDFAHNPLATVIWSTDRARVYAQAPQPVLPWFAWKSATHIDVPPVYVGGTPYWDEMLWHVLLSTGSTNVLAWNVGASANDNTALDDDLAALARETENAPTLKPLTHDPVPMNAGVLVSGARAGNTRVYRVTVKNVSPVKQSIEAMLPGEAERSTIDIPAGQVGVWIIKPAK